MKKRGGWSVMIAEPAKPAIRVREYVAKVAGGAPIILGLSYGVVEYFLVSSSPLSPIFISPFPGYLYRAIYGLIFFLPFASRNYWKWFAKGAFAMAVEDASYWGFYFWQTGGPPMQWAWYYPVWSGIPLLYLTLPVVFYSYMRGARWRQVAMGEQGSQLAGASAGDTSGPSLRQPS
jgi:hypothetical protein